MKDFIYLKDCSSCNHKRVCKFKDTYESNIATMQDELKKMGANISPYEEIIEVTIQCKLYSAEYQINYNGNHIFDTPSLDKYTTIPGDIPSPTFDPYKITCKNLS